MVEYGKGPKRVLPDERFWAPGVADRAAGAMVGMACGDALGAPYEFGGPYPDDMPIEMKGGGAFDWEPGEWTDDTSMAIPLVTGTDRMRGYTMTEVVEQWIDWARRPKDIGRQTELVLRDSKKRLVPAATLPGSDADGGNGEIEAALRAAAAYQERFPDAAGNGSLMRTAPAGLAGMCGPVADYAQWQSALTHCHQDAREACAIWSTAITHAVTTAKLDLRVGIYDPDGHSNAILGTEVLNHVSGLGPTYDNGRLEDSDVQERIQLWESRIAEAEANPPTHFRRNGWVVHAFQAAWSAIVHSGEREEGDPRHLQRALDLAVRSGGDTDTVAAIAGGLIGASYGVSAVPLEWKRAIHGWPGWRSEELVEHAIRRAGLGGGSTGWPSVDRLEYKDWGHPDTCAPHPHDPGVYLGAIGALEKLPRDVDAVVSLCRVGKRQIPDRVPRENRVAVWVADSGDPADNAHLDYVLTEAADMVAALRAEGHTVLLHCVRGYSRTPTVAALYAARHLSVEQESAMAEVAAALPRTHPNPVFRAAYRRIVGAATVARGAGAPCSGPAVTPAKMDSNGGKR